MLDKIQFGNINSEIKEAFYPLEKDILVKLIRGGYRAIHNNNQAAKEKSSPL
jgi:hypothetical protein